jgi:hypothetical protein
MHRLPHAAGMRSRCRNRQSHRDKDAHQQQNQQRSRGQTMHELQKLLRRCSEKSVSGSEVFSACVSHPKSILQL